LEDELRRDLLGVYSASTGLAWERKGGWDRRKGEGKKRQRKKGVKQKPCCAYPRS